MMSSACIISFLTWRAVQIWIKWYKRVDFQKNQLQVNLIYINSSAAIYYRIHDYTVRIDSVSETVPTGTCCYRSSSDRKITDIFILIKSKGLENVQMYRHSVVSTWLAGICWNYLSRRFKHTVLPSVNSTQCILGCNNHSNSSELFKEILHPQRWILAVGCHTYWILMKHSFIQCDLYYHHRLQPITGQ